MVKSEDRPEDKISKEFEDAQTAGVTSDDEDNTAYEWSIEEIYSIGNHRKHCARLKYAL